MPICQALTVPLIGLCTWHIIQALSAAGVEKGEGFFDQSGEMVFALEWPRIG